VDWRERLGRQSFAADDEIDIAETLLALSEADDAGLDAAPYRDHMAALGDGLTGDASAAKLSDRLAVELGYRGDTETYDDMRNADIVRVIDRRRGLPVALGLLYMIAARQAGWHLEGMNFPGHFLLRLTVEDGHRIIDPFNAGRVLQPPDMRRLLQGMAGADARLNPQHMGGAPARQVIVRLQNNIKVRALQAGDGDRAAEILARMSLFAPAEPSVWLEWSGIEAGRGNMRRAIALLDEGANHAPDEASLLAMADARRALGRRLN
jgi:regulator of sirC expression with transglutaminase-like and TPR domain